jgi:hypothetical protein
MVEIKHMISRASLDKAVYVWAVGATPCEDETDEQMAC